MNKPHRVTERERKQLADHEGEVIGGNPFLILLRQGNEVEAVRIVVDSMNVGLLEATRAVRSYGGRQAR